MHPQTCLRPSCTSQPCAAHSRATRYRPGPPSAREALSFVDAATLALLHAQAGSPVRGTVPVLDERAEVHQATGMVSVQAEVGLAEALVLLRARAFAEGRPLGDVARDVLAGAVDFGEGDDSG
jgi:ANTAR domain